MHRKRLQLSVYLGSNLVIVGLDDILADDFLLSLFGDFWLLCDLNLYHLKLLV